MPGHVEGFNALAAFSFGSRSPMTYTQAEWRAIETRLKAKLKAFRLPGHDTHEVTLISMAPTATTISKHALEVDRAIGALRGAKRRPGRRRPAARGRATKKRARTSSRKAKR